MFFIALCVFGREYNVRILFTGLDTLSAQSFREYFDFVLQRPCTSETDLNSNQFYSHIRFGWDGPSTYVLVMERSPGRFKCYGKVNLDTIKQAPPDSELTEDNGAGLWVVFRVPVTKLDSLKSLVGNTYVVKTATNPRDIAPMYAKIRLLKFIVKDSANCLVDMVFLWACDIDGRKNLTTQNLDTFNLATNVIDNHKKKWLFSTNNLRNITKFTGERFIIPDKLIGCVNLAYVYDLNGRLLEKITIKQNQKIIKRINTINSKNVNIAVFGKIKQQ